MTVHAVGAAARWDERRNTSAVRPGSATATDALRALAAFRRDSPAHAAWVEAGAPPLTEAEHLALFGAPYERKRRG